MLRYRKAKRKCSILIEDNKDDDGDIYRYVVFLSKPEMIQSEILLTYKNSKKGEIT